MTIFANMEITRMDKECSKVKQRPERASSLALPHGSLLDFSDEQQEQCNSVALLPINANMVLRRHSSHYYPMLESEKQKHRNPHLYQQKSSPQHQQKQQNFHLYQECTSSPQCYDNISTANTNTNPARNTETHTSPKAGSNNIKNLKSMVTSITDSNEKYIDEKLQNLKLLIAPTSLEKSSTFLSQFQIQNQNWKQHSSRPQQQINPFTADTALATKCLINKTTEKHQKKQQQQETIIATPPPIPKRTFRSNFAWNPTNTDNLRGSPTSPPSLSSEMQTQSKSKQQLNTANTFIYPQTIQHLGTATSGENCTKTSTNIEDTTIANGTSSTQQYVDIKGSGSIFSDGDILNACGSGYDTGGASDDDRMSLENSVFEESLNSTPVKIASNNQGKLLSTTLAAKTLAGVLVTDVSNAIKRSNRSSSSTVDSSITSSGYGSSSHSERLASTSTTADFRSRFSSVDTQSSVDSCITEKTTADSPLAREVPFKVERPSHLVGDVLHTLNNNEMNSTFLSHSSNVAKCNNNNNINNNGINIATTYESNGAPKVPARGVQRKNSQLNNQQSSKLNCQSHSQQSLNNSIDSSNKASSTVPNSTSTSSAASAGSGISIGSSMSISASGSRNSPLAPQPQQTQLPQEKRPPMPPVRLQNVGLQGEAGVKNYPNQPLLTVRNQINHSKRSPPIQFPRLHQRQDSNLSSDSFSATSSPGYNSKNLIDAPLLQNTEHLNKNKSAIRHQNSIDSFVMSSTRLNCTGPVVPPRNKFNLRQDSTLSSDSFSQTSSPGYNTKLMEAPLLPSLSVKRLCNVSTPINIKQKFQNETIDEMENNVPMSPITKCVSTPASLQTIVRFQNGAPNTMSLPHQIISRRKSSNPYITNGRLKFRLFQILINALALLAIAGGLAAYFNAYPTIKFVNKTIINTIHIEDPMNYGKNPAPGTCLPIIVKFCQGPQIPYNFTVFPNYIGHFGQLETQVDMDAYEALVDVRCYELVSLFLCTLFVPKCGTTGATVPPCKSLCTETMRRCGFFFDVFGLSLPEYLNCKLFKDFENSEDCVGFEQVQNVMIASANPKCDGFMCDNNRCIPQEYVCDGNLDCMDQADENKCEVCDKDQLFCGNGKCVTSDHICNGVLDCPFGQDEKNCIRLSERNGDLGKGVLEVYRINTQEWTPACVKNWDRAVSPSAVCSMLGYSAVNATSVITQKTHRPLLTSVNVSTDIWKMYTKKKSNLMKEFANCTPDEDYPIAELTCSNFECGKVKKARRKLTRRIIGGAKAHPGSWPFLAAILGGPEKVFYCAGVLISDRWVLTASHCIGNHTIIDLEDWTIQLGVTRRNSYTYSSQEVKVKTVIPHPLYNTAITHDNDIALFQLAKRVAFHEHLLPVCLPPPNMKQLKADVMCTVIGWGKRRDKDPTATYEPIVNEVQVPIIRRQQCDEWLDNLTVSDGMICAGYEEGGKDACQGDSGGPLLCPYPGEKDRWFVGGIVSWGIMCAHPKLPGVYANVIKYLPWINEQIQKYSKEESYSKYDAHPGGPDILSNLATVSLKTKQSYKSHNRSPMDIDYYESNGKKLNGEYIA